MFVPEGLPHPDALIALDVVTMIFRSTLVQGGVPVRDANNAVRAAMRSALKQAEEMRAAHEQIAAAKAPVGRPHLRVVS